MLPSKCVWVVKCGRVNVCRLLSLSKNTVNSYSYNSTTYNPLRSQLMTRIKLISHIQCNNHIRAEFYSTNKLSKKPSSTDSKVETTEEIEYDETKHEEYEQEAQKREMRVRYFKKVFSSLLFFSTLTVIMYARRKKKAQVDENLSLCNFIRKDDNFLGSYNLFCRYGKDSASPVLPASIVRDGTIKDVKAFEVRPDDIFVCSFPKTGTTWVQEITYRIRAQNNLDDASDVVLENRFPFLEYPYPGIGVIAQQKSPRLIKTHLPYDLLPKDVHKAKIIYITRNPKDTVVSYYHFARMLTFLSYDGTFEEFLEKFKKSELPYTPFFSHVDGYLTHKDDPNVLIITYESLSKDPAFVIQNIANFLDRPITEAEVNSLAKETSFSKMKTNPAVNYEHWDELGLRNKKESEFMRQGTVGDWRHYFNPRLNDEFDIWEKENNSKGFKFEYEI